jgi:hypothetical protein
MLTVEQIEEAHSKFASGADFSKYIQKIKDFSVKLFETWVKDSNTKYLGDNNFKSESAPKYKI